MSTPTPTTRKRKPTTPSTPSSPASQNGRLFTDSDEIRLVKTFRKVNKAAPSSSSSTSITMDSPVFERINYALNSKFTHAQITDKLRRLRIKYHKQARSKSLIKTPHDQELFKIAQSIWGKKTETKKDQNSTSSHRQEEEEEVVVVRQDEQEERAEVNLEEYPVLVSEFSKFLPLNVAWREALKSLGNKKLREMNEKWMTIGFEEAKIVTKKAELVKEQTNLLMQVFGDTGNANGN